MYFKNIYLLSVVSILLFSSCGEDDSTDSSTSSKERSLTNSEVAQEDRSTNEDTSTEDTYSENSTKDENVVNVSTITEFRQALEDATANGKNDRIVLSAGTYKTTADNLGTFAFDDNEEFYLTIEAKSGLSYEDVILSGDNLNQVFNFDNSEESTLILKNLSIINGNSETDGGGVYSNQNIKIDRCKISNNSSDSGYYGLAGGGGFYVEKNTTLTKSIISENRATTGYYSRGGGFVSKGKTIIKDSVISNNSAEQTGGGFVSTGNLILIKTNISQNSATWGGGFDAKGVISIKNSSISKNSATYDAGGFTADGEMTIINSSIFENSAENSGGGFKNDGYYSKTILINSIVSNNSAKEGAIFTGNHSYVSNNIFVGNKGSINSSGYGLFVNNIFDKNDVDITLNSDAKVYNNYIDYTKIEDNDFNIIKKRNLQPASVGEIDLNSDNTLKANSPAIDKGLNPNSSTFKDLVEDDEIYNEILENIKIDMNGKARINSGTIDIGAIEYR